MSSLYRTTRHHAMQVHTTWRVSEIRAIFLWHKACFHLRLVNLHLRVVCFTFGMLEDIRYGFYGDWYVYRTYDSFSYDFIRVNDKLCVCMMLSLIYITCGACAWRMWYLHKKKWVYMTTGMLTWRTVCLHEGLTANMFWCTVSYRCTTSATIYNHRPYQSRLKN